MDAWIDFNQDGSFGGAGEQIADTVGVVEGDNVIEFDVPSWAVSGETYARFRLSSAGDLGPRGAAVDGEVEDYGVEVLAPPPTYGNFVPHEPLAGERLRPLAVFSVDMDGDGDVDVLSASQEDSTIAWYENDGTENFEAHEVDTWSGRADGASSVFAADMDSDGDMDVLAASRHDDKIAWYENEGEGAFTSHTITTSADDARSVFAVDVDGDGDMDVLSASYEDNKIAWYEHDGNGSFVARTISNTAAGVWSVFAADMDRDGDMDVLAATASDNSILWYENTGDRDFVVHAIPIRVRGASTVFAADMDGDCDMDVVFTTESPYFTDKLEWYENDGSLGFTEHFISSNYIESAYATDVNGDGRIDVLTVPLAWHDNHGNGEFAGHAIDASVYWGRSVYGADIDGDGDMDMLSASEKDDRIAWYEQVSTHFEILGYTLFREIAGLDLTEGDRTYRFSPSPASGSENRILTVDASFDSSNGVVTMQLLDSDGQLIDTDTGTDGYARIDFRQTSSSPQDYTVVLSGTSESVDVRIANLVKVGSSAILVYGTNETDAFAFSVSDTFDVSVNGIEYRFDRDVPREFRFYGRGEGAAVIHGTPANETVGLYAAHPSYSIYTAMAAIDRSFRVETHNVVSVTVIGGGGQDGVGIVDSAGGDTLTATPSQMAVRGTLPYVGSFELVAVDFSESHANATQGGHDTAILTGSSQADLFKTYPRIVKLMGAGYYNRTKFFETVQVDMGGGIDRAVVNPSDGADVVWAMKDDLRVAHNVTLAADEQPAFAAMAYDVSVSGWEYAYARANGPDDWVELHDSALNDVFVARPHKVEMMNAAWGRIARGAEYRICARGFQNVSAIADQGGAKDVAKLYDSGEEGVDIWAAAYVDGVTWSSMSSPSRLLYEVFGFEYVGGYGFNGGLGEDHGTNRKDLADGVDFVFQYGYWEGEEAVLPGPSGLTGGRGEYAGR